MKQTRKQKIAQQQQTADWLAGRRADRAIDPIRAAMDRGDLVITRGSQVAASCYQCDGDGYAPGGGNCPRCGGGGKEPTPEHP